MSSRPDVVVIGAGVIGCACAYELAAAGARVRVFDRRRIGGGASQASAGVLAPYIEGHQSGPLLELGRQSLGLYDGFVERVTRDSGHVVPYARAGTLEIALDEDQTAELGAHARTLARLGVEAHWLDAAALKAAEPLATSAGRGALLIPHHGFVAVPDLVQAIAAAATRHGAVFWTDIPVRSVGQQADGRLRVVRADEESIPCDYVVMAAGSWTGRVSIAGEEPVVVNPVRGQLLHLAWPTRQADRARASNPGSPAQPMRHVLWSRGCYVVPWPNGRVLLGATVEEVGFDERATVAGVHGLLAAGRALIPDLDHATFVEARVGLRPASPDGLPIVGRSATTPGVVYATGHYRNGVLLAPLTARLVRDSLGLGGIATS